MVRSFSPKELGQVGEEFDSVVFSDFYLEYRNGERLPAACFG